MKISTFQITVDSRVVPAVYMTPAAPAKGVVMIGHGGGGHKQDDSTMRTASHFIERDMAVLAIDGPVHGERRTDNAAPKDVVLEFRALWQSGARGDTMAADWSAALSHIGWQGPIGYWGVSMGTFYGLPFLATDRRVNAAVLGLWGIETPQVAHLKETAAKVMCPILFIQKLEDETFNRAGTIQLFDAIGVRDKRLYAYPGPHAALSDEQLAAASSFLVGRLEAAAS